MKILYVSTISNTINAFMVPHVQMLLDQGYSVDIACNVQKEIDARLIEQGCKVHDISFNRSPLNRFNYKAYQELKKLVLNQRYDLVHTHTPVASAITRLACKNIQETKVFYTAHGFHFYKGAPLKNWLIYYPLEKWLSKYTDTLITINKEDYERAKKYFKAKRIKYLPGVGLEVDKFRNVMVDSNSKREEVDVPKDAFVILSIGELNKNKNHDVVIKALAKLNNPQLHYIICGKGPLESYLNELALDLGIDDRVHLLGFRTDIAEICKSSDVFAFPSKREGLGMAALEAMACGLPIITSNVHGIVDYSVDGKTGYTIDPLNIDKLAQSIFQLYSNKNARRKIGENNIERVKKYSLNSSISILSEVYGIKMR